MKLLPAAAALLLLACAQAEAQLPPIHVTPFAGYYNPIQQVPSYAEDGETRAAWLDAGRALGVNLEMPLRSGLGIRATWLHSDLTLSTGSRDENLERRDASLDVLGLDVKVQAPAVLGVRSYLLAGAGFKRYAFDVQELGPGARSTFGDGHASLTAHLGAGAELSLGRVGLVLEASHYGSTYRAADHAEPGAWQNDLAYTLGARVRLF